MAVSPLRALESPAHAAPLHGSLFYRTIVALQSAEQDQQQRFAQMSLLALAEIYLAEADLARAEAEASANRGRLIAWSVAVSRYADGLFRLLDEIDSGTPVQLSLNEREVPSVAVDRRMVMLAHPRREQQPAYERRVLEEFCRNGACAALTSDARQPIPAAGSTLTPEWMFSEQGLQCRHRNLQVSFPPGDLARQKSLCRQFFEEAEQLATEIAWQQRHSVVIAWDALQIKSTPGRTAHLVSLNNSGDALLLSLPLIESTPGLLADLTPWLRTRFDPGSPAITKIEALTLQWK